MKLKWTFKANVEFTRYTPMMVKSEIEKVIQYFEECGLEVLNVEEV